MTTKANLIHDWYNRDIMFYASHGDLSCDKDLKCLQGKMSVPGETWQNVIRAILMEEDVRVVLTRKGRRLVL